MDEPVPGTARALRHRLNKMERWYAANAHRYNKEMRSELELLIEIAATPSNAADLAACLLAWTAGSRLPSPSGPPLTPPRHE